MKNCCNPYQIVNHLKVRGDLRNPTAVQIEALECEGIKWVSDEMYLCRNCRGSIISRMASTSQVIQPSTLVPPELPMEVSSSQENETSSTHSMETSPFCYSSSSAAQTTPSSDEAFDNAPSVEKKIEIVKLLPRTWSFEKVQSVLEDVTEYMYRSSRTEQALVPGITALYKGRPSLDADKKDKIINFFLDDTISRPFPGLKDCLSIKQTNGKRIKVQ